MSGPLVALYEGVSGLEALGALAALKAAGWDADLASSEALVLSQEGARLIPARLGWERAGAADVLVLPGGDVGPALRDAALARALRERRGKWTLVSGDAVQLAAAAGLTDGRVVAVPPGRSPPHGARASHARLVADGRLLTCTGGDAVVDLVLHYVAHERGDAPARRAAESLGREYRVFAMGAHD